MLMKNLQLLMLNLDKLSRKNWIFRAYIVLLYKILMRGIRAHVNSLISGLPERDMTSMALGLSRYKLKFSPDKVDTMIVQAIALLVDLDKELNNYIMRCREWYG